LQCNLVSRETAVLLNPEALGSRETADDVAGVSAFGWHRLNAGDDACSEVRLDRLARLGRCGQLDLVDLPSSPPLW